MTLRRTLKRSVKNLFLLAVLPLYFLYLLISAGGKKDSAFQSFSQGLSLIPGKFGIYIRAAFYRLACPGTSDEISVGFLTVLSHRDTTIERGVYIGPQCNIGKCTIGEKSLLGSGVHVLSGSRQHNFSDPDLPMQDQGGTFEKISIGPDCWLGNQALVMASVPNGCIIAAGSVYVKESHESGSIFSGNPARIIKKRPQAGHST